MPAPQFTPAEVLEIRHQHAHGVLDVRMWADVKLCSIETVRRVARGDTYRHAAGVKAHPVFGGLQGQSPAGLRPAVGRQTAPALDPAFQPPATQPLADLASEPDGNEAAASLARLQSALAEPVPGDPQASAAVRLLDELQAAGEAQRPQAAPANLAPNLVDTPTARAHNPPMLRAHAR